MRNDLNLSIIIVSYNVRQLLLDCIQSVIETASGIDYEIIVVDNASTDRSSEAVKEAFPEVKVIVNRENAGFARANNQGYEISKGEFILLLNPDTIVKSGAIENTLNFLRDTPDAGVAGCRIIHPDGTLQKSIHTFPSIAEHLLRALFVDRILYAQYRKNMYYRKAPFRIDYASGAFLMVRREALGEMPLLNSDFFMYAEEKDLSLRLLNHGWKTYFVHSSEIIHHGEQSTKQMETEMFLELQKSQVKFISVHYQEQHKSVMLWSYYLVLLTSLIVSSAFVFTSSGRRRFRLFLAAVRYYPSFLSGQKEKPGF